MKQKEFNEIVKCLRMFEELGAIKVNQKRLKEIEPMIKGF